MIPTICYPPSNHLNTRHLLPLPLFPTPATRMWPACLHERFITPRLRAAFDALPRQAELATVVTFLSDQFCGDFDGMGEEFERMSHVLEESESESEESEEAEGRHRSKRRKGKVTHAEGTVRVDAPFRIRVLLLLHRGDRKQAREEVRARGARLMRGLSKPDSPPRSNRASRRGGRKKSRSATTTVNPALSSVPLSVASSPLSSAPSTPPLFSVSSPASGNDDFKPSQRAKRKRVRKESQHPAGPERPAKRARRGWGNCAGCKKLKQACDRARPGCVRCEARGIPCEYPKSSTEQGHPTSTARRRAKQGRKALEVTHGPSCGDSHTCSETRGMSNVSPGRTPTSRKAAKTSIPLSFEKPKRRKMAVRPCVNIDNDLLKLLGLPFLPTLPAARKGKGPNEAERKANQLRAATAGKGPLEHGIRSSTFATVMRLVAGLPKTRTPHSPPRCPPPSRRPKVWAQVSNGGSPR